MNDAVWHAAYIRSEPSERVATAVRHTLEGKSNHKLRLVPQDSKISYDWHACGGTLLCVSPQERGWVGLWGASNRFHTLVMEEGRYSGILVDCEENIWQYSFWNAGAIVDWFVSKPKEYFAQWREESICDYVKPYLLRHGIITQDLGFWETIAVIDASREVFRGNFEFIQTYCRAGLSETNFEGWLGMASTEAMNQLPNILDIPFVGSDYQPVSMGVYFDIRRNVASLESGDNRLKDLYQQSKDRINRINEFQAMAFGFPQESNYSVIFSDNDLANVYYWGP
jgi:hypothetical protein